MAIGAYTMAILVVKEGWSTWLAAPLAVAAAAAAGVLLGLPSLRLRADYFAIVTIAFSEIVRYVATNEQSLTGGSQGTIALGKVGEAAQYNGQWERFQPRVQGLLASLERRRDARDRLGVAVVLLALVWLAVRTPWGRCCGRSARTRTRRRRSVRTRSPTSCRRSRSAPRSLESPGASTRGSSRSSARRLPAATHLLRVDDRDPRRARPRVGGSGRRARLRLPVRRHALSRLRAALLSRAGPNAPTCA